MKVIKRNSTEVVFDSNKIKVAVTKANNSVDETSKRLTDEQIEKIVKDVVTKCESMGRAVGVEEIQDMVEFAIMTEGTFEVAKHYITYRYDRQIARQHNTTDDKVFSLIDCQNEEVKQENSNKNPTVNSVQRDYMAGEMSKDLTKRF
ncbi:MAG: ATP cone domain-containing protein, partial [Clostridia bacterium]|nr:ATP cone domain-containing protein [Clostridia bacterium]